MGGRVFRVKSKDWGNIENIGAVDTINASNNFFLEM